MPKERQVLGPIRLLEYISVVLAMMLAFLVGLLSVRVSACR
jgi:hypothetical protein